VSGVLRAHTMTSSARQVALVTGGTRGIGLGVARALAREGWDLALCGVRREADVTEGLEELRRSGAAVQYCAADVARPADRARLAEHGIPVFEVRPGIIATDMTAAVHETYDRRIADGLVPARRWGESDDVGRVVAALVRGDLPYATGTVIHVDGGLSVPRL